MCARHVMCVDCVVLSPVVLGEFAFFLSRLPQIFDQMELESTRVEAAIEQEFGTIIAAFEHRRNLLLKQVRLPL